MTTTRRFVRHYLEMVAAMMIGMAGLGAASLVVDLPDDTAVRLVEMAVWMTVPMVAWMRFRGHGWAPTLEMAAAMDLPFLVLLPLFVAGQVSLGTVMVAGHVLMLVTMALAMVRRVDEYAQHHHPHLLAAASSTPASAPTTGGRADV